MFLFLVMQLHRSPIIDANSRRCTQLKSQTIKGQDHIIHKLRLDVIPAGLYWPIMNHFLNHCSTVKTEAWLLEDILVVCIHFMTAIGMIRPLGKWRKNLEAWENLNIGMYDTMNNASRSNRGIPRVIYLHAHFLITRNYTWDPQFSRWSTIKDGSSTHRWRWWWLRVRTLATRLSPIMQWHARVWRRWQWRTCGAFRKQGTETLPTNRRW